MDIQQVRSKRRFTLIEVLLSIAVLACAIVPLLAPQLWIVKEERAFLNQIQAMQAAQEFGAFFLEKIYEKQISWAEILSGEEKTVERSFFKERGIPPLKMYYSISTEIDKENKETEEGAYLLKLTLSAPPHTYEMQIHVHKAGTK